MTPADDCKWLLDEFEQRLTSLHYGLRPQATPEQVAEAKEALLAAIGRLAEERDEARKEWQRKDETWAEIVRAAESRASAVEERAREAEARAVLHEGSWESCCAAWKKEREGREAAEERAREAERRELATCQRWTEQIAGIMSRLRGAMPDAEDCDLVDEAVARLARARRLETALRSLADLSATGHLLPCSCERDRALAAARAALATEPGEPRPPPQPISQSASATEPGSPTKAPSAGCDAGDPPCE